MTSGTQGYERFIPLFIASSQALDFHIVCKDFVNFLPVKYSHVLDLGSGAGQNAAALDKLGFKVTAVEPMGAFLNAAINTYKSTSIIWLNDSLPDLVCLDSHEKKFDFVLIDAVWHHLSEEERVKAASKISRVIKNNGRCALSLRNGPPGIGSKVLPTDSHDTIELFERYGFKCIFKRCNQASVLPNKEKVKWARIVLEKSSNAN
ncbi:class I SAM-dependent methyltransferase [Cognaticolwellia mytili]|uniref:class I SAM-dependent methyltransferase n=1 Tax=Cognaticolwellia mytili TaxID=1888913 RepID=UPI000A174EBD|nr:class I SAM-dependent methyltransferase [Cognaticolwellia mytili]